MNHDHIRNSLFLPLPLEQHVASSLLPGNSLRLMSNVADVDTPIYHFDLRSALYSNRASSPRNR